MELKNNRLGIYEKAIPNHFSWHDKFKVTKKAGFDFLEISIDESDERLKRLDMSKKEADEILFYQKHFDLPISSMCLSGHRRFPFGSQDSSIREKAYDIMQKAFLLAEKLNIRNIQLAGYDVYYEKSNEQTKKMFYEGLKWASKMAEHYNIMLSIEVMDTPFMGTIERIIDFKKTINSPYLKVYPDVGNITQFSLDPYQEFIDFKEEIIAIHLKDTLADKFKCVEFGQGNVDFNTMFKTLKSIDYKGPFLIEMWADNNIKESIETCTLRLIKAKKWLEERMAYKC